jgi:hypothetical protein
VTADSAAPTPNDRVRRRNITLAIAAGIVLIVVLVAGVLVGVQSLGGTNASGSDGGAGGSGSGSGASSETARPQPSETAAAAPVITGPNPQSCDQIYSKRMFATLEKGGPLNDETIAEEPASETPAIAALLADLPGLRCSWGQAGEFAIITEVKQVTAEQSAAALAALKAAKFSCYAESGGTRCVVQEDSEGGSMGQSHFLRENVWLATDWLNWPQAGYTADMVRTLWG